MTLYQIADNNHASFFNKIFVIDDYHEHPSNNSLMQAFSILRRVLEKDFNIVWKKLKQFSFTLKKIPLLKYK